MDQYQHMLRHILLSGERKSNRTGTDTIGVFGYQTRYSLDPHRFPLLTTKKVHLKSVIVELLWFLRGDTNVKYLHDHGVSIWDEWVDENGNLGPIYGKQWRSWTRHTEVYWGDHQDGGTMPSMRNDPIDQIAWVINRIKTNPECRRLIVSAWNPAEIDQMALAPCHCLFQFNVTNGRLNCQLYQRSADAFLGVPFNIASYALLTMMIAQVTGLAPGELVHTFGDLHIYVDHLEQVDLLLSRTPRQLPTMRLDSSIKNIDDFRLEHFHLEDYDPWPAIKAPVAK